MIYFHTPQLTLHQGDCLEVLRQIPKRAIMAGCPPDGVVLDPFTGSGTTLMVAKDLGRRAVGIELNPNYCAIAQKRCNQLTIFQELIA